MSEYKRTNPLSLAVLVLLYERPMHPYEMAATLRERHKEESIKLRYGTLYTVIDLLRRAGLIRAKKTSRAGNRPERTVYAITKSGEAEMRDWMRGILSTPSEEFPQFEAGLSLLPALPPDEAADVLDTRLEFLKRDIARINGELHAAKTMGLALLFLVETEYRLASLETEHAFVEDLIKHIRKDGCGAAKAWKKFHRERPKKRESNP